MTIIFRIENQQSNQGLWYDKNGNYSPFINSLPNAKCKDLPMDFDPTYQDGGLQWLSGCSDMQQLRSWFSEQDLIYLSNAGYNLYRFEVSDFRQVPGHVIFTRERVIETSKIDMTLFLEQLST